MEKIDIKKLKEMKYNPRKINDFEFQKLKQSIKEFGDVQPLVINKDNTVIGGHQRLKALKELDFKEVDIIRVNLSEEKAKVLNLALNKISGEWDYEILDRFVKDIKDMDLTGFTENEIKHMMSSYNYDDLAKDIKDLELEHMQTIEWTARFKNQEEFENVRNAIISIKQKNGLGCFKSDYSNAKALKLLCVECIDEEDCNAKALKLIAKKYEKKNSINRKALKNKI